MKNQDNWNANAWEEEPDHKSSEPVDMTPGDEFENYFFGEGGPGHNLYDTKVSTSLTTCSLHRQYQFTSPHMKGHSIC